MNSIRIAIVIAFTGCLVSCATKSGPKPSKDAQRNAVVEHHIDGTQMTGAQIFAKYNTAVFMVFTSDGSNGYQGSGFFIDSRGLAVSNKKSRCRPISSKLTHHYQG